MTPTLISGAWLDCLPTLAFIALMAALVILTAYAVESIKHARKRRPKPRYRRSAIPTEKRPRELEIHPGNGQAL